MDLSNKGLYIVLLVMVKPHDRHAFAVAWYHKHKPQSPINTSCCGKGISGIRKLIQGGANVDLSNKGLC